MKHLFAAIPFILASTLWLGSHSYALFHVSHFGAGKCVTLHIEAGTVSFEGYYEGVTPSNVATTSLYKRMSDKEHRVFMEASGMDLATPQGQDPWRWIYNNGRFNKNLLFSIPIWPLVLLSFCPFIFSIGRREKTL